EDVIDLLALELRERRLDLRERRAPGAQIEVAAEVDHAQADAVAPDDGRAVARLDAQEVGGPQDPRLGIEVRIDLAPVIGVVAERDRVDAGGKQRARGLRRDPESAGDVLAVDDHERRLVALAQLWQALLQRAPANPADEVADEQD